MGTSVSRTLKLLFLFLVKIIPYRSPLQLGSITNPNGFAIGTFFTLLLAFFTTNISLDLLTDDRVLPSANTNWKN